MDRFIVQQSTLQFKKMLRLKSNMDRFIGQVRLLQDVE